MKGTGALGVDGDTMEDNKQASGEVDRSKAFV